MHNRMWCICGALCVGCLCAWQLVLVGHGRLVVWECGGNNGEPLQSMLRVNVCLSHLQHIAKSCDDGKKCTIDTCDKATGCKVSCYCYVVAKPEALPLSHSSDAVNGWYGCAVRVLACCALGYLWAVGGMPGATMVRLTAGSYASRCRLLLSTCRTLQECATMATHVPLTRAAKLPLASMAAW